MNRCRTLVSRLMLLLATVAGILAFLYPFLVAALGSHVSPTRGPEVILLFALLAVVSLVVLLTELSGEGLERSERTRVVALLAVLVAIDAVLRFVPSLIGASPIFFLIMVSGYVFGARFGFLMGALTLLVSAALTGGLGPWLPFQMLCAGWIGATAAWLPRQTGWHRRLWLASFGAVWGFLFGALMNLWFWPFAAPGVAESGGLYWTPGMALGDTLQAYARFYLATSVLFDGTRALGNAVLALLLSDAVCNALERWRDRLSWHPWSELADSS
ncbi:MAG: ECF transporter S component [Thermomicrobium sp.]|nr:ECF transporter S component [Thermomicrobium sp.]